MADCCSVYCDKFEKCDALGIVDFMKVLPKRPKDLPNKNWCESFEEETKESQDNSR